MSRLTDVCAHLALWLDITVHGAISGGVAWTGLVAVAQQPSDGVEAVVIVAVIVAVAAIQVPPIVRWSRRQRVTPAQPAGAVARG